MDQEEAKAQPDFASIGAALVALAGTFQALGHVSPMGSVADYIERPTDEAGGFTWDMFAVCSGDDAARQRLVGFTQTYGVADVIAEAVAR